MMIHGKHGNFTVPKKFIQPNQLNMQVRKTTIAAESCFRTNQFKKTHSSRTN